MTTIKRLFDFPYYQLKNSPLEKAIVSKVNGKWEAISTQEYIDQSNQLSRALLRMGVEPNDKIAVISTNNRTEWNICDIGIMQVGAQNVPIYPTISEKEFAYVLNHSESKYCFISDKEVYDKVMSIADQVPSLKAIYTFNEVEGAKNWKEVIEKGVDKSNQDEVEARKDAINENDQATLIYTSGTTGKPKGVMLSHKNIASNALNSSERLPLDGSSEQRGLSFLPLCHVYERMLVYLYQYSGTSIYYAESIEAISDNLKEVKPHVMSAVPRLLEKVYDKIITTGSELSPPLKAIFFWAVSVAEKWEPYDKNGAWYGFKLKIAQKLIFKKWKEALGGNLKAVASGAAPLQPRLARIYNAAGIPIMEGYGLTETSPVIAVNDMRNGGFRIGTVGKLLKDTEVKIADDGEILVKGPQVMLGYYKDEELTKSVMTGEFFHTEDIGEIDKDGFLKITDRKKQIFKTSGGKYVAPQIVENSIKQSRFIEHIMVIGEGEKMPTALIQPNFEFIRDWAKLKNLSIGSSNEEIAKNKQVFDRIAEDIALYNKEFGNWEQVKDFRLTPDEWTIEGGQLTPTLKTRRKIVKNIYKDLYKELYGHEPF
ncbi:MAG TPA: long-chain fatty acid--CoA ligase [Flavobacteriaceae bacterium]|nr:long-chain fatty acid--CoA ligase [Flavobacteriaceae bacterium]